MVYQILRSFDQFSNMVLDQTSERRVLHTKKSNKGAEDEVICYYTDILLGLYLVRGDSMVLLGEVDNDEGEDDKKEAVVTAGHNSSFSAEGLTGSGLLMGSSVEKEQAKKHMKKVSLKEFEEMEKKLKEKKEADPINELTWEFDLDLVV
jgi:small nuclear ribonucleoprotein (snRNP)-like protein